MSLRPVAVSHSWPDSIEANGTYAINLTASSGSTDVWDAASATYADSPGNSADGKLIKGFRISNTGASVGTVTIDIDGRQDGSTTPGQTGGGSTIYTILGSYSADDILVPGEGIPFGGYLKITTVSSSFAVTIFYTAEPGIR